MAAAVEFDVRGTVKTTLKVFRAAVLGAAAVCIATLVGMYRVPLYKVGMETAVVSAVLTCALITAILWVYAFVTAALRDPLGETAWLGVILFAVWSWSLFELPQAGVKAALTPFVRCLNEPSSRLCTAIPEGGSFDHWDEARKGIVPDWLRTAKPKKSISPAEHWLELEKEPDPVRKR